MQMLFGIEIHIQFSLYRDIKTMNGIILFSVPLSSASWILLQNSVKELVNCGYEVTAIVNQPITNFTSENYTEILIDPSFDLGTVAMKVTNSHCPL